MWETGIFLIISDRSLENISENWQTILEMQDTTM